RRRAQEADLIIVNHHLLLSDLVLKASAYGAIIPPYRGLVIDEAHMLEEVATAHLGRTLSSYQLTELASDVAAFADRGEAHESEEGSILSARGRELKAAAGDFYAHVPESSHGRFLLATLREDEAWRRGGTEVCRSLLEIGRALA